MTGQMLAECIREMNMRGVHLAHCIQMMVGM